MTADELAAEYGHPFDVTDHAGHRLRLEIMGGLVRMLTDHKPQSHTLGADLACGKSAGVSHYLPITWHLGDITPGWEYTGPIEETIHQIPHVDVMVMGELIEHLDDPESVLRVARQKADALVVSTPINEGFSPFDDENPQHYWGWDQLAVSSMLTDTGWKTTVAAVDLLIRDDRIAPTQIWAVR